MDVSEIATAFKHLSAEAATVRERLEQDLRERREEIQASIDRIIGFQENLGVSDDDVPQKVLDAFHEEADTLVTLLDRDIKQIERPAS